MASHGTGLSGGDRIFIEFAKRWSKHHQITIVTWTEGIAMMQRQGLKENSNLDFFRIHVPQVSFLLSYIYRIVASLWQSVSFRIDQPEKTIIYSSSEFWMDSLPCAVLKLRYPQLKWAATWYQTAPSPLKGFSGGVRQQAYRLNAFMLWATQLPIKPLLNKFADNVLVNNELEKLIFPNKHTVVVLGAVDTDQIKLYLKRHPGGQKKYTAIFQGRFHPQKGVIELVDIWQMVVSQNKNAKLAMIGDGPLMREVKKRIKTLGLEKNIDLVGYLFDGEQKYKLFSQSLMVVHPAFFDSGGMATAEAMAFGIPAVGFDLPAYSTYYPVGLIKAPVGDLNAFANEILSLLKDSSRRNILGFKAGKFIHSSYSWDHRTSQILRQIVEKTY